jgi:DtxR family Mn-dependent transcriptional regulator
MENHSALTPSLEDYLEAILQLEIKNRVARVKDISEKLSVQMPSVTGALKQLKAKNLINYEKNSFISLTEEGMNLAKTILQRHEILAAFLQEILMLDPVRAEELGCRIEHSFTLESSLRMKNLMKYLKDNVLQNIQKKDWEKILLKK